MLPQACQACSGWRYIISSSIPSGFTAMVVISIKPAHCSMRARYGWRALSSWCPMQQVHRAPRHLAGYLPPDAPVPLPQRPSAPPLAHAEGASARDGIAAVTADEPGERGCAAGAAAPAPSGDARAEAAPAPAVPEAPASPPVEGSAGARGRGPGTASDRGRAARLRVLSRLDDSQVPLLHVQQLMSRDTMTHE